MDAIRRHRTSIAAAWLAVAVALTIVAHASLFHREYDYEHAWIDAIYSTMARSFAVHGVIALRGVPIQNNAPIGLEPDAYLHWPPLFPIVLGLLFRVFGESEATAHALMLVNILALAAFVGAIARQLWNNTAAIVAAFFTLTMPVTVTYGAQVLSQYAAVTLLVAAVYFFIRRSLIFAAIAISLAVLMSWEAALAPVGLILAAWIVDRTQLRAAFLLFAVAILTALAVLALYLTQYPQLASDLWQTIVFRAGFGSYRAELRLHTLVNTETYGGSYLGLKRIWQMITPTALLGDFGRAALFAIPVLAIVTRRSDEHRRAWAAIAGLFAPWLIWFVLMPGHIFHPQMMLFGVPAAAVLLGYAIDRFEAFAPVLLIAIPLVMIVPFLTAVHQLTIYDGWRSDVRFGQAIAQTVPPNAVVLTPDRSGVPLYYSHRHLIRGVANDERVDELIGRVRVAFPGAPVYLAFLPEQAAAFPKASRENALVHRSRFLQLYLVR